ncbi:MAG TPA: molybdopterin-synthase adenylyltransferase MoeB [Gemmatimonadaceae bacterium]|nr:molybdopterin-synthase adenylyltransferase MoeB [Gemmatimonadaceae bacterium]
MLSAAEFQRYSRQIALPDIGPEGQERLRAARVLIVGAGGLGSPVALYLAAAGVGTLGIIDFDKVDASNLHRQLLHGTNDVGRAKVDSAADRLRDVNPHVSVETHEMALTSSNALDLIRTYGIVVDASDNFATRYLVNDACVLTGVPNVYGSVERFEGQVAVFATHDGPCYRCLFREPPPPGLVPTCAEAGVFGVMPGLIGMLQATEVIKLLVETGEPLIGRLLVVDAKRMRFRTIEVRRDPACPVCGTREQTGLIDYEVFCGVRPPTDADENELELEPRALAHRLSAGSPLTLIDVREPWEFDIAHLPGAELVPGSAMPERAKTLPRDRDVVLYCHVGGRSGYWLNVLRSMGFTRVSHLRGGIDAWSSDVDPSVPRY